MGNCHYCSNIENDPVMLQYNQCVLKFVQLSGFNPDWAYFVVFGIDPYVVTIAGKQEYHFQIQQFILNYIHSLTCTPVYKFEPTIYPARE